MFPKVNFKPVQPPSNEADGERVMLLEGYAKAVSERQDLFEQFKSFQTETLKNQEEWEGTMQRLKDKWKNKILATQERMEILKQQQQQELDRIGNEQLEKLGRTKQERQEEMGRLTKQQKKKEMVGELNFLNERYNEKVERLNEIELNIKKLIDDIKFIDEKLNEVKIECIRLPPWIGCPYAIAFVQGEFFEHATLWNQETRSSEVVFSALRLNLNLRNAGKK